MTRSIYKRALIKLSGESLKGDADHGIDPQAVNYIATQMKAASSLDVEIAAVVGGGNIWRGEDAASQGMDRATADYAGMLATVINSLTLQDALERHQLMTRIQVAIQPLTNCTVRHA